MGRQPDEQRRLPQEIKVATNLAVHSQKPFPIAEVVSAIEKQVRNAQAFCRRAAEAQFFQPGCPIQYNRPLPPVSNRNSRIEEDLIDQLFNSSEKRLARLLLLLANFGKEGRPEPIVGKFSQETLAEMIGTTRSRVSNFMNKFRDLGFISYNGTIEVHSSLLSVLLNDKPQLRRDEAIDAE